MKKLKAKHFGIRLRRASLGAGLAVIALKIAHGEVEESRKTYYKQPVQPPAKKRKRK